MFDQALQSQVRLNGDHYVELVTALAHSDFLHKALELKEQMEQRRIPIPARCVLSCVWRWTSRL